MAGYIDPFGAPEFLVDDIAFRKMVGSDFVRLGFYTQEECHRILRVKIVFPISALIEAQADTRGFVTKQQSCRVQRLMRMGN